MKVFTMLTWSDGYCQHLMSNFFFYFKNVYEISCFCRFGRKGKKNSELWDQVSIGKEKLIDKVDNVASYAVPHNNVNILGGRLPSMSIIKRICLVGWEAKSDACRHFKIIGEGVDPTLHSRIVVEGIAVEVAEFRGISFQDGVLEGRGDVGFYKGSILEGDQALEMLDKQHYILIINIFAN